VLALAAETPAGSTLFKKVDSLLRGNVEAECRALREARPEHLLVVAPAFPRVGRTTIAARVVEALGSLAAAVASPATVRDPVRLVRAIDEADDVLVCQAETDGDLDAIVSAVRRSGVAVTWVGAGGLAAAVARAVGPGRQTRPRAAPGPVLAVVGSALPLAREQAALLVEAAGGRLVELPVAELDGWPARLRQALGDHVTVVVTLVGEPLTGQEQRLAESLAQAVAPPAAAAATLVLCGGATARAVLDACRVSSVDVLGELEPGVVASRAEGLAALVVTKSGSFGDAHTLARAVHA
jgi:uncharacterized protein YgbK (DUF1537 family)